MNIVNKVVKFLNFSLQFCQYPLKIETFTKTMGAQSAMPKCMTGYLHTHLFISEIKELLKAKMKINNKTNLSKHLSSDC